MAGSTVDITVSINGVFSGEELFSLGFEETIPTGWTFNSLVSTTQTLHPDIDPAQGSGDRLLEFAFLGKVTSLPQSVTYRLNVPAGQTSQVEISGTAIGVFSASSVITDTETTNLVGDVTPPTAVISKLDPDPTNLNSVRWSVDFNEPVTGFDAADVTPGGSLSAGAGKAVTGPAAEDIYTVTVTPSNPNADGSLSISIDTGITDAAGNPYAGGNGAAYTLDNTRPTVVIGAPTGSPVNSSRTATYPVSISGASSINLLNTNVTLNHSGTSGGTITIQNGTTATPSVLVTGVTGDGSYTISIAEGIAQDAATNTSLAVGPSSGAVTVDNTRPTVAIGSPTGSPVRSAGTATYPITVSGVSTINLLNTNVTLNRTGVSGGTVTVLNGTTATPSVQITGVTGDGSYTISIAAGIAQDAAGNTSLAQGPSASAVTVDNTAPTLSIGVPTGSPMRSASTATYPVTVSGASTINLTNGNVSLNHSGTSGGIVTIVGGTTASPTVQITGVSGNGSFTISIAAGVAQDAAGNTSAAVGPSASAVTVDNTLPAVTVNQAAGQPDPDNTAPINFTAVFSEAINPASFAAADVTISGTAGGTKTVSTPTTSDNITWNFSVSGMTTSGTVIADIAASAVQDLAGNNNAASTSTDKTVTWDATAPSAPTLDLEAGSDSGLSSTDNYTNDATPTLSGTSEANATVTVTSSLAGALGTVSANGSGAWTLTAPVLANGVHNITATATDAAGNVSAASTALAVTVDTVIPAVPSVPDLVTASDTGTSSTDNLTRLTGLDFSGTREAGTLITMTSTQTGSFTTAALGTGTWSITGSGLAANVTHSLRARATDQAGNQSAESAALAVTIDATAPVVSTRNPAASATVGALPSIEVTYSESVAGVVAGSLTVNASPSTSVTGSGAGPYAFSGYAVPADGAVSVSLLAGSVADTAGNTPAADNWSYTKNSALPTITWSATGVVDGGLSNGVPAVLVTAIFSEAVTGFTDTDVSRVNCTISGFTALSATNYRFTVTPSAQGAVQLSIAAGVCTATATPAGRNNTASPVFGYTFDSTAPSAPTLDLEAGSDSGSSSTDNYTNDATPTLSGTSEANATVTVTSSLAGALGTVSANGSGAWTLTAPVLANGVHNITATATDSAGNVSAASTALAVTVDTVIPAVPSVPGLLTASDTGTSSTDNLTRLTSLDFSGTREASTLITMTSTQTGSFTTASLGTGTWSITGSGLAANVTHSLRARATDQAGNQSAESAALAVQIDTVSPGVTLSSTSGSAVNVAITITATLTESSTNFTAGDASSTNASVSNFIGSGTSYSFTLTPSAQGSFSAQVNASTFTDAAGNINPASNVLSRTYDSVPPGISIGPPSTTLTRTGPVTYAVSYTDATSVTLNEGQVTINKTGTADALKEVTGAGSASRTVTLSGITGDGMLGISIAAGTATDAAGNTAPGAGPATPFTVINGVPEPQLSISRVVPANVYLPGTSMRVTLTVSGAFNNDQCQLLTLTDTLPVAQGWSYLGNLESSAPLSVVPNVGDNDGQLDFTFSGGVTQLPQSLSYDVSIPTNATGIRYFESGADAVFTAAGVKRFTTATSLPHRYLAFIEPNATTAWEGATPNVIRWIASPVAGQTAKIKMVRNGSLAAWVSGIVPSLSGRVNEFEWYVPSSMEPASNYRMQVYAPDYSHIATSDFFQINEAKVKVRVPVYKEVIVPGNLLQVKYTANLPTSTQMKIKLESYPNRGVPGYAGFTLPFAAAGDATEKTYSWIVDPNTLPPLGDYYLYVYEFVDKQDYIARTEVVTVRWLDVTAPGSDKSYKIASPSLTPRMEVRWKRTPHIAGQKVKVRLMKGASPVTNMRLTPAIDNTGSYGWNIPTASAAGESAIVPGNDYRIKVYTVPPDPKVPEQPPFVYVEDISDFFSITN